MKLICLLIYILISLIFTQNSIGFCGNGKEGSEVFRALDYTAINRSPDLVGSYSPVSKINDVYTDNMVEAYYFNDLGLSTSMNRQVENQFIKIIQLLNIKFNKYMYFFNLDSHQLLKGNPLVILFDNIRDSSYLVGCSRKQLLGYYHPIYETECGRSVIVIDISSIRSISSINKIIRTFSHELTHWIRQQFHPQEERWLNEGIALLSEFTLSEGPFYLHLDPFKDYPSLELKFNFLLEPRASFLSMSKCTESVRDGLNEENQFFSRNSMNVLLFLNYIRSHFGSKDFLKNLVTSPFAGEENIFNSIEPRKRNIFLKMAGKKEGNENSKNFFQNAFLNYQLSLGLNAIKSDIRSFNQLIDLRLEDISTSVPTNWSVSFFPLSERGIYDLSLKPWSTQYYAIDQKLLEVLIKRSGK